MQKNIRIDRSVKERNREERPCIVPHLFARWLLVECLWVVGGWLLGQAGLAFATFPLGIALLCASGNHILPILMGLIFSGVWYMEVPAVYITVYVAAALVRLVSGVMLENFNAQKSLSERLFELLFSKMNATEQADKSFWRGKLFSQKAAPVVCESFWVRVSAGAACALILGLYRVLSNGFQYYDFFASVFTIVITVAATVIYSFAQSERQGASWLCRASHAALLFSFVFAAKKVSLFSLPLAPVLALFFTLNETKRKGRVMGCICAVLVGVASSVRQVPAYLLAALVCGMMKKEERGVGVAAVSALAALTWLVYIEGIGALLLYLPAFLLSGAAYTASERIFGESGEESEAKAKRETSGTCMEELRHKDTNDRFRGISEAFSSLSEVFYNLSDRFRRPGTLDLRHVCDRTFDRFCTDCPHKTVCWGMEYADTLETVNRLTAALHTKGKVTKELIPPMLAHRCEQHTAILESINRDCARLTGEMLRNNRAEIFAMDYEAAASIINDALEEDDGEYRFDEDLEERISEYLSDAGIRTERVRVYGKRRRQIVLYHAEADRARVTPDVLQEDLGEMCGLLLDRPVFELDGRAGTVTLRAKRKFGAVGAQKNLSADGGVSGDSVNLFANKKDFFYALISDGMGAGREAAATSNLCSVFLEKMLRAGNRAGTSVRVLNNLICSRSQNSASECSTTVDLLELDLMTGECVFVKSGAAPSFLVRGESVRRLDCGSAPIGILNNVEAQSTSLYLREGDVAVMVSDGILASDPSGEELISYLKTVGQKTPEEIVSEICAGVPQGKNCDDRSAVAIRVVRSDD